MSDPGDIRDSVARELGHRANARLDTHEAVCGERWDRVVTRMNKFDEKLDQTAHELKEQFGRARTMVLIIIIPTGITIIGYLIDKVLSQ